MSHVVPRARPPLLRLRFSTVARFFVLSPQYRTHATNRRGTPSSPDPSKSSYSALAAWRDDPCNVQKHVQALRQCAKDGDWRSALRMCHAMFDDKTCAYEEFDDKKRLVSGANATILSCGKGGAWLHACDLLTRLREDDRVVPNVTSFSNAISACEKGRVWSEALRIFRLLQCDNLTPNVVTYSALLSALGRGGQWEFAVDVWQTMRSTNATSCPSPSSSPPLSDSGSVPRKHREQKVVRPNIITYSALLTALASGAQWEKALALLEEMHRDELRPDVICLNTVLHALAKGREWKRAVQLVVNMERDYGVSGDVISFNAAINACEKANSRWEECVRLLNLMKRRQSPPVVPNARSYTACLAALNKGGQWPRALQMLETMKMEGVRPDDISCAAIVHACASGNCWESAVRALSVMRGMNIPLDAMAYSSAMTACEKAGAWEHTLHILDTMCRDGVTPNEMSFGAALSACARGRSWPLALHTLSSMHQERVQPDVVAYTCAISACEKGAAWQQALRLLDTMHTHQMTPDVIAYNATISACQKGAQWQLCLNLLHHMVTQSSAHGVSEVIDAAHERDGTGSRHACPSHVTPDLISYRAVIEALHHGNKHAHAALVYRDAVRKRLVAHWKGTVLDFHDYSVALAKTAFRVVLDDMVYDESRKTALTLVVGRGVHSNDNEAVLKPTLMRMLTEEFTPALEGYVRPADPGAIRISAASINRWMKENADRGSR